MELQFRASGSQDDAGAGLNDTDDFDIAEVKLFLKGAFTPEIKYTVLYSVRKNSLWDAFVRYSNSRFSLTVGQFKVPFSLAGLAFGNPAPSQAAIRGPGIYESHPGSPDANPCIGSRDIGASLQGSLLEGRLLGALAVCNGAGINVNDDNDGKDYLARFAAAPFKGTRGPVAGLGIGGALWVGNQRSPTGGIYARERYDAFLEYKLNGFHLVSEYIVQIAESDAETEIRTSNWYVQAAWRSPFDIEPIARYEIYDPDEDTSGDREDMTTLGVNLYLNKHLALRINYNIYQEETVTVENDEVLVQLDVRI